MECLRVSYDENREEELLPEVLLTDSRMLHDSMKEAGSPQENWLDSVFFSIGYKDAADPEIQNLIRDLFGSQTDYYDFFVTKTDDALKAHQVLFYEYPD